MILAIHIITSIALIATSFWSLITNPKNVSQKLLLACIIASVSLSFITGVSLIFLGANLARLCIIGLATITLAIYSSKRILIENKIRIEL